MKRKINACFFITGLFAIIGFSNCAAARDYDFSLKNTLSIFLLNNGKDHYFCIPVQYLHDFKMEKFEFKNGSIQIGNYEILLNRNEINISVYLNENADENGYSNDDFKIIYLEENGRVLISKMDEPLTIKNGPDEKMNHYYIFIEKFIKNNDLKKIINEYEKGNVYSNVSIWYDITIDNELQAGNGMLDDFELYNGPAIDSVWFPQNLDFFRSRYY